MFCEKGFPKNFLKFASNGAFFGYIVWSWILRQLLYFDLEFQLVLRDQLDPSIWLGFSLQS